MKMELKLKSISNMKYKKSLISLVLLPLISCGASLNIISGEVWCFGYSKVEIKLYEGKEENVDEIKELIKFYDSISDNYVSYDNNLYQINTTNEEIKISPELYDLLKLSFTVNQAGASYFNPLCGSLSKKWKDALADNKVLSEQEISVELEKMNNTELLFKDDYVVQRIGEAEIDLGGIAKGYALDKVKDYLTTHEIKQYLVDAASSSILLGEKNGGYFNVRIKDLNNSYLKLKNCFVSTSGNKEQGKTIGGVRYSHIVNPLTGSVVSEYDTVIVVSEQGYFGDALSTSLTMNTIDEIKNIEQELNIKTIVIKNKSILYCNEGLEVLHH